MKTNNFFRAMLIAASLPLVLISCDPKEETETVEVSTGLFVLGQGKFQGNNANITYFDYANGFASNYFFEDKNNRGLGDTGQDMIRYGSKIYIAMYGSNVIEVINSTTGISIDTIKVIAPRYMTTGNGKIYVTLYGGKVAQIDTISMNTEKTVNVGPNPEGIALYNNKLYVANSGGLQTVKDSTISVIDIATFTETKKIKVNLNPASVKVDSYGDIYVKSNGNYGNIQGKFQRINTQTEAVTDINITVQGFDIVGDYAYIYNFEYDASWQVANKKLKIYDVKNEVIVTDNFTGTYVIEKTPYIIAADPITNDVFLGVTDYVNNGKMYCFDKDGKYKYSFTTGINPAKVVFVTKK